LSASGGVDMIIHKPLNEIFSAYSNIVIMRELRYTKNGFSGREIAKRAGLSAPAAINSLSHLESLKIVNRQIGGRDHIFTLNFSNYFVKVILLPLLDAESKYYDSIVKEIKRTLAKFAVSVILFGSVARKEESVKSDFDICIVYSALKDKKIIEEKVNICRDELHNNYGIALAPFYISTKEFRQRAKLMKPPINEIVKEGILLFGQSIKELIHDKPEPKKEN
jgi:predicted nucleotidyltransferase